MAKKSLLFLFLFESIFLRACIPAKILPLMQAAQSNGHVVVIDVLRAFTTTAYAFAQGAERILLVDTEHKARLLLGEYPQAILVGEQDGIKLNGFDHGNSPSELQGVDLKGKTIIMRTTAGTQGVLTTQKEKVLVSSFVVAQATAQLLKKREPEQVTFLSTGQTESVDDDEGDEDKSLADYLIKLMNSSAYVDPDPYLERVSNSPRGRQFISEKHPHFPIKDLELALLLDRFNFAMEAQKKENAHMGVYFLLKKILLSD